jgi:AcrR family transcriptional regulator
MAAASSSGSTRRRPGPKARTSHIELLRAAGAILDAGGLDAISMRRLAAAVGLTPMALYRHVPGKGALLDALVESILTRVRDAAPGDADWSEQARRLVRRLRQQLVRHPWLVTLLLRGPVLNRGVFAATDVGFQSLLAAGFDGATAVGIVRLLIAYTVGFAGLTAARRDVERARYRDLPAGDFPSRAAVAAHLGPFDATQFEFGLDVILAGIAARHAPAGGAAARRSRRR